MFYLEKKFADEMVFHAQAEAPNECCGIITGANGRIMKLYPTTNTVHSPVHYRIDPNELLTIYQEIEDKKWEFLGIYHSHTHTEAYPSDTDVKLAFWPQSLYFIISLNNPAHSVIRLFQIIGGKISERELRILVT